MADEIIRRVSKINSWKPKEHQKIVEQDGKKIFVCHFEKVFGYEDKLSVYDKFVIGKDSYSNQLNIIAPYINFFINNYDDENELVSGYLRCKFALDKNKLFNLDNVNAYIAFIYETLFTDSIINKIKKLVEENYFDDIDTSSEDKKKFYKNEKKHLESLEFTNEHVKMLLAISFGIKIMCPVIFHYTQINNIKVDKNSDFLYNFYSGLFDIFGTVEGYELSRVIENDINIVIMDNISEEELKEIIKKQGLIPEYTKHRVFYYFEEDGSKYVYTNRFVDMFSKLYVYIKAKILESNANNGPIFGQREIFGTDISDVIRSFTRRVLISENMVKYLFSENYDPKTKQYKENVIGFNKVIIKFQLHYFLKEQYEQNLTEVTNDRDDEGLSGSDKLLMNQNKIDEGLPILSFINIKSTIEKIKSLIDVKITEEEIDYYMVHHHPSEVQTKLVQNYYARIFGNCTDLNILTKREYITILLLLKKKLLIDLGYMKDENGVIYYASLPYLFTGNLCDKVNNRIIRNNELLTKIKSSDIYQDLMKNKYSLLEYIKPDELLMILSQFINTKFTYVAYEFPEMLGTEILYSENKISDEILVFLKSF